MRRAAFTVVPPRLMKYQIAWRNWRRGEAEIRLLRALVDPARIAVDVGAHLGAYTFFLARIAREVHAFEPLAHCARFLRRAYGGRVHVHGCALAEAPGCGLLQVPAGAGQTARLVQGDTDDAGAAQVQLCCLDDFVLDGVGFIKIDAEGAETRVLQGARRTIAGSRPVLLVEIEQRHLEQPIDEVFAFVEDLGYAGRFMLDGREQSLAAFSLEAHQLARLRGERQRPYVNNFLFRPR